MQQVKRCFECSRNLHQNFSSCRCFHIECIKTRRAYLICFFELNRMHECCRFWIKASSKVYNWCHESISYSYVESLTSSFPHTEAKFCNLKSVISSTRWKKRKKEKNFSMNAWKWIFHVGCNIFMTFICHKFLFKCNREITFGSLHCIMNILSNT